MVRKNAGTKGVPRAERERQILDVAALTFGVEGYTNTSVADIARRAGISKPLVYQYFTSKEGLFHACVDDVGDLIASELERVTARDSDPLIRALEALEAVFALLEGRPQIWRLFFDSTAPSSGPVAATIDAYRARIDKVSTEGVRAVLADRGSEELRDISMLSAVWTSVVNALVTWWLDHPEVDVAEMTERCARLFGILVLPETDPEESS